jgi:cytochrome c
MKKLNFNVVLALCTMFLLALLAAGCSQDVESAVILDSVPGGDPSRGETAIHEYGCVMCHVIPGVSGANGHIGPPLTDFAKRYYIAGNLKNTPENLIRWIRNPDSVEPGTAMPNIGVSEQDARDIAAYLSTLK